MTQGLLSLKGDAASASARTASWPGRIRIGHSPRRILQAGDHLFQAGELGRESFIVRTGYLKNYRVHRDGEEQILGMHGPGDVLGFEALIGKPALSSVIALEICSIEIAELPCDSLWSEGMPALVEGMYRELQRFSHLLYMDRHPAERRLAEFLLGFSRDEQARGKSPANLTLPLNRRELARLLGLAPETLSRTFTRYQDQGLLSVNNRQISILDLEALNEAAGE